MPEALSTRPVPSRMRDYRDWHKAYDDPDSDLSHRLAAVQRVLREEFDRRGPCRILSLCAGDGRDVLGVLAEREDRGQFSGLLVELDPDLAAAATARAVEVGSRVHVVQGDAARPETFASALPADVVLLVGIFGNISDDDIRRTILATQQFCNHGALVLWTRGDLTESDVDILHGWFDEAHCEHVDLIREEGLHFGLGVERFTGQTQILRRNSNLFTFQR